MTIPYMTGSPSAAFFQGDLCIAFESRADSSTIDVVQWDGTNWFQISGPQAGDSANSAPALVSYEDSLLCFWLTVPQ